MFDSGKDGGGRGRGGLDILVCRFLIVAQVLEMKLTVTCIN